MKNSVKYVLIAIAVILVIIGLTQGEWEKGKNVVISKNKVEYEIEIIVPDQMVSIKPVFTDKSEKTDYNLSMARIKAGIDEIGKHYKINSGQTIIKSIIVEEQILYIEPKKDNNSATICISGPANINISKETNKPD